MTIGLIASAALLLMNADNFWGDPEHLVKSVVICAAAFAATFFGEGASDRSDCRVGV